ncbi:hypothetical protein HDE70_000034 [Pedobacter cryoconitis]|nr:hypothetical protein [Pedobacter cryoconitis]
MYSTWLFILVDGVLSWKDLFEGILGSFLEELLSCFYVGKERC